MKTVLICCTLIVSASFIFQEDIQKAFHDSGLAAEFAWKSEIVKSCVSDETKNDDILGCIQGQ